MLDFVLRDPGESHAAGGQVGALALGVSAPWFIEESITRRPKANRCQFCPSYTFMFSASVC